RPPQKSWTARKLSGLYWPQASCPKQYREVGLAHFFYARSWYDRPPRGEHPTAALRARFRARPRRHGASRQRGAADLHRSSGGHRPGALRTGHPSPQLSARRLLARGVLARSQVRPFRHQFRNQGVAPVSKEIVDAVKALEQEKGISADKLMDALEDALLSAYK